MLQSPLPICVSLRHVIGLPVILIEMESGIEYGFFTCS